MLGRVGEGFTQEVTFDLGLGEGTGKNYSGGKCSPSRANTVLGVLFPMMDGHVPSCPPSLLEPVSLRGNEFGGPAPGERGRGREGCR